MSQNDVIQLTETKKAKIHDEKNSEILGRSIVHVVHHELSTRPEIKLLSAKHIQGVLDYGALLKGVPYKWWTGEDLRKDGEPFWSGGTSEVPLYRITSCSCTGLLNLIRRRYGLSIPGSNDTAYFFPGGTYKWFQYLWQKLKQHGMEMEKIDVTKNYPKGSLLFRPYSNIDDQGHVAIVFSDNKGTILNNSLLHCYPDSAMIKTGFVRPGVTIDPEVRFSHGWKKEGFYKFVIQPHVWLTE